MQICTFCGGHILPRTSTCPSCGQTLVAPSQPPPTTPYPLPPAYQSNMYAPLTTPYPKPPVAAAPRLSKSTTVLLVALALVCMVSGIGLIFYAEVVDPAQLRAQATATVQAIQISNAHGVATMQAQATSNAQAYAAATATTQAQAQATATAGQGLYQHATSGVPALSETLTAPTNSNWDTYSLANGDGCIFAGNALNANITQAHFYLPCFAQSTNFANFALEVQVRIVKGNEGGIIFRANNSASQFYIFRISQDGTYELLLSKDSKHSSAVAEDVSPFIHTQPNQPNTLTIIAQQSRISLYVNHHFLTTSNDTSYQAGQIGIFAGDNGNATLVAFSNLRVWNL